jgi:hypothetical protein
MSRTKLAICRHRPPPVTICAQLAATCYNLHAAGRYLLQFARSGHRLLQFFWTHLAATCYNLHAAGRNLLQFASSGHHLLQFFGRSWPPPVTICTQLAALLQFARSLPPPVTICAQLAATCYNLHAAGHYLLQFAGSGHHLLQFFRDASGRHLLQFARSWPPPVTICKQWPPLVTIFWTQLAATCYNLHAAGRPVTFARSWPPPVTICMQLAATCYNLRAVVITCYNFF